MPLWSVEDWRVRIAFSYSALGIWRPVKLRGYGGRTKSKPFLSSYPNQRHLSSFIARSLQCLSAAILMLLLLSINMADNLGPLSHLVKWGQKVVTTPKTLQLLVSSLKTAMLGFSYFKLLLLLSGDVEINPGPVTPEPDDAEIERPFEAYQQALKTDLRVNLKYLKLILLGVPRSGKTSLKRRLVGEITNLLEPSTGVIESSDVVVSVDVPEEMVLSVSNTKWSTVTVSHVSEHGVESSGKVTNLDEEIQIIYQFLCEQDKAGKQSNTGPVQQEKREGDERSKTVGADTKEQLPDSSTVAENADQSRAQDNGSRSNEKQRIGNDSHDERNVSMTRETDAVTPDPLSTTSEQGDRTGSKRQLETPTETGNDVQSRGVSRDGMEQIAKVFGAFNNVMQRKSAEKEKLKAVLENTFLLNLVDTGGQLAFLEMLPLLTVGPALYLIFFKLNEGIKERVPVRYCCKDGEELQLEESYSTQEIIHQVVSSIHVACCSSKPETAAMLVGTHRSELKGSDEAVKEQIEKINSDLEKELVELEKSTFSLLLRNSKKEIAFAVDNKEGDGKEINNVRGRLEEVIKECFRDLPIPASWFMFSIILRRMGKPVLTLQECEEIGKRLNVNDTNLALWFLHHCVGIVMHYQEVAGLKNLVICNPQIIFDLVTKLIAKTLTSKKRIVRNRFRDEGRFKRKDIQEISDSMELERNGIKLGELIELLKHRSVIALITPSPDEEYFMPAVLPPAEDSEPRSRLSSNPTPAPVMIRFKCGIVPIGVFCATVADLVARKKEAKWTLMTPIKNPSHILRRNRVSFRVQWPDGTYYVTLIATPKHYALYLTADTLVLEPNEKSICYHVLETVCGAVDRVISKMKDIPLCEPSLYQIGFHCLCDPESEHMVVNVPCSESSESELHSWFSYLERKSSMICLDKHRMIPLSSGAHDKGHCGRYMCWFQKQTVFFQVCVPSITKNPCKLQTVGKGKPVTFTVSAEGKGTLTYQWVKDGNNITDTPSKCEGSTSPTLRLTSVEREHEGLYWCVVSNEAGSTKSEVERLVVVFESSHITEQLKSPHITKQTSQQPPGPVVKGETATFTVSAEGRGTLTYQWVKDGNNITDIPSKCKGSTSPTGTLRLTSVEGEDEGSYWCVVSNEAGSTESEKEELVVGVLGFWLGLIAGLFLLSSSASGQFRPSLGVNGVHGYSLLGKGACDGLGGTVKRLAARASLQRPYNDQLMTPRQLFDWACGYCSNEDHVREQSSLEQRFQLSRTIPGTRKLHSFVPISDSRVEVRFYSASDVSRKERVALARKDIPPESIAGFVTRVLDENWWLACVLEVCSDTKEVKLTFLHPHGPSNSFKYPEPQNIRTIKMDDILTLVDPRTQSGRVYSITKKEMTLATEKLRNASPQ